MGIWPPVVCGVYVGSVNDSESPYPSVLDRKCVKNGLGDVKFALKI